jgi:hypothetical protein
MPTAANQPDPHVAGRLRTDLKWALSGSLLLAAGQAALPPLAWLGGLLWAWVCLNMGAPGGDCIAPASSPGMAPSRCWRPPSRASRSPSTAPCSGPDSLGPLTLFLPGFLMPLVTGAAGQLAPVWVEAGRNAARHAEDRARITRWNGPRALLFLAAAVLPLLGYKCSGMPALTALVWFGIVFAIWLYRDKN